jgi:hypothetical protein
MWLPTVNEQFAKSACSEQLAQLGFHRHTFVHLVQDHEQGALYVE